MKFAHLADVHIGSWRDPSLSFVSTKAFTKAVKQCLLKNIDFILISGDFFNTSLPSIDSLKIVVSKLREIKEQNIKVYAIAGSHDFSPTGKTMLDVLENAGLLTNVMKGSVVNNKLHLAFTTDQKTGAKITGIIGRKGMLERKYFENLHLTNLEEEPGFKIFMFHTAIGEFKPEGLEKMDATPLSSFPMGFNYYAGGHVHEPYLRQQPNFGLIANPGPLFPNNFREIEKLGCGGFYIVDTSEGIPKANFEPVLIHNVHSISIDCNHKSIKEVEGSVMDKISNKEFNNTIVTIRLYGKLKTGKPSDLNFKSLFEAIYSKSAHFVMKNTAALTSHEFEEVKISSDTVQAIEDTLIKEHHSNIKIPGFDQFELTKKMMDTLKLEKEEGETSATFENRIKEDVERILNIEL